MTWYNDFIGMLSQVKGVMTMAPYETAPYQVLKAEPPFELRAYDAFVTASVDSRDWINSDGFNQIFNYISGSNEAGQKISMTTPVFNELESSRATTEFVMPREVTPLLPRPQDPSITLKSHSPVKTAVITFSGRMNEAAVQKHKARLTDWIHRQGLTPAGPIRLARYNPPFIPPFLRRNEILMDVRDE